MGWTDYIDDVLMAVGAYQNRKDRKAPDVPEPIDPELLKAMMFQNSVSPWGNMSWNEGDDGSMTSTYEFTPAQQALYDRGVDRAANPDQAYQMSGDLRSLKDALTSRRLQSLGITPQGGGQSSAPFDRIEVPSGNPGIAQQGAVASRDNPQASVRDPSGPEVGGGGGSGAPVYRDVFTPGFGGQSLNDRINQEYGTPLQGTDPGAFERFMAQYGDEAGTALSILSGIPGMGTLAKAWQDQYWSNHQWQSPIPDDAPQPGLGPITNDEIAPPQQSPNMGPEQFSRVGSSPFFYGNRGSGFYDRWGNRNPYDPYVPPKPASKDK